MSVLEPFVTAHPSTGAFRSLTPSLLSEAYLAPEAEPVDLLDALSASELPWSQSMTVAPTETAVAVSSALRAIAKATQRLSPDEIDLSGLDRDSRVCRHLSALRDIWRQLPDALPEDLRIYRHVLGCSAEDALEPLPLVLPDLCPFASPIEQRLHARLLAHHGLVDANLRREWQERTAPMLAGAQAGSSLWRIQRGLTGAAVIPPAPLDDSVSLFSVRDEAEEAQFAAARAQELIGRGVAPDDIALLVPDESGYFSQLASAFDALGVPISGLPALPARRDLAGEALLHLLLCLQSPAPAMALASLYVSPLMPWPQATGLRLAREVMQGRFEPHAAAALTGRERQLYRLLRSSVSQTPSGIREALDLAARCLSEAPERREDLAAFQVKLASIRAVLSQSGTLDWAALFRLATPSVGKPTPSQAFVEGVSVFVESALPWRRARHLIALGMSGNRWPRAVAASPLFLDGELELLRDRAHLHVETRGDRLARRLERLRRQFLCATESLTLLRPRFSASGAPLSPAPALSLVARTIGDGQKGTEDVGVLIQDLRALAPERWPFAHRKTEIDLDVQPGAPPDDGVVRIGHDLLRARPARDGRMRPQSPSRLETLLVSPLAWSLSEFGAEPTIWAPETLDAMVAGTIAHDVLEHLFLADTPLPEREQIETGVAELLASAIRRYAPYLQRSIWAVEREGLARDIRAAAHAWRGTLEGLGARVIANEIDLRGQALGILLRGRADCLLQLADRSLLVVDHKKSATARRRARLEAGWDLQLALYRAMLMQPEQAGPVLEAALAEAPAIGVAYHLINDQGVLVQGLQAPDGVATVIQGDISGQAMTLLATRLAEVGAGLIRLNSTDDRQFFEKTAGLMPYALDASVLVSRFMVPGSAASEALEDSDA